MILQVLMFFNTKIECYTQPIYDDHDPRDAATQLKRSLVIEKDIKKVEPYKNLVLYHLGSFDDQSGKFDLLRKPELLLDCRDVVEAREDYVESKEISRK